MGLWSNREADRRARRLRLFHDEKGAVSLLGFDNGSAVVKDNHPVHAPGHIMIADKRELLADPGLPQT